jgi:hypothetical protein
VLPPPLHTSSRAAPQAKVDELRDRVTVRDDTIKAERAKVEQSLS